MPTSEAQKRANRKYKSKHNKECLKFGIGYSPGTDVTEGQRLKDYLEATGQSANAYLKAAVKADLDAKGIPYPDSSETEQCYTSGNGGGKARAKVITAKRDEKAIRLTIGYAPGTEGAAGRRVKKYLEDAGQTAGAYIKELVKSDLDRQGFPYPGDETGGTALDNERKGERDAGD